MHHVLWLATLAAWDHFTRKREMKTYGCMIWQVLLCCIQLQNFFFFWKEGKCFAFVSAVVYERKNKCDGSPNLHCQPVIFTHQLRSPAVLHVFTDMWIWRAVEPTFQWVVLLQTASIHSQVRSHSPTPSASRKNFWRLTWTKGFFFCWYGGCTLLHRERTCDGVSDDLSTLSNSPYTPKAYKSRLRIRQKKEESGIHGFKQCRSGITVNFAFDKRSC